MQQLHQETYLEQIYIFFGDYYCVYIYVDY